MAQPHDVLGVKPGASLQEIKAAYRRQSLQQHPDVCPPERRAQAEQAFKELSEAYARLTGRTPISDWQTHSGTGHRSGWMRKPPAKFSNPTLAALLALPLLFAGVYIGTSYDRLAESSWRPHGLFNPPVNPFLRDDMRATQTQHWGKNRPQPP